MDAKRGLRWPAAAGLAIVLAAMSVVVTVPLGWAAAAARDYAGHYARLLWLHRAYGFRDTEFFKRKIYALHETRYQLVG